jgi:hypothetical protein
VAKLYQLSNFKDISVISVRGHVSFFSWYRGAESRVTTYLKSIARSIRHATGFVYQFPGKDGGIISILNSSNGVPPCQDSLAGHMSELTKSTKETSLMDIQ